MIAVSVADAATVNPNGIKTLSANDFSTFSIKGNAVFSNGSKILPNYCRVLCSWVIDYFLLAEKLALKLV